MRKPQVDAFGSIRIWPRVELLLVDTFNYNAPHTYLQLLFRETKDPSISGRVVAHFTIYYTPAMRNCNSYVL